jgi:hypothetical protein
MPKDAATLVLFNMTTPPQWKRNAHREHCTAPGGSGQANTQAYLARSNQPKLLHQGIDRPDDNGVVMAAYR